MFTRSALAITFSIGLAPIALPGQGAAHALAQSPLEQEKVALAGPLSLANSECRLCTYEADEHWFESSTTFCVTELEQEQNNCFVCDPGGSGEEDHLGCHTGSEEGKCTDHVQCPLPPDEEQDAEQVELRLAWRKAALDAGFIDVEAVGEVQVNEVREALQVVDCRGAVVAQLPL